MIKNDQKEDGHAKNILQKIPIIKSKTSEKFTAITPSWISLIIFAHKSQMTWFWNVDDY
jgi:hypothetical protein